MKSKTGIIFIQLGSPLSPAVKDIRFFLRKFLSDPYVVDLNPYLWKLILYLFILPTRPRKSAILYERIWDGSEFPLIKQTREFKNQIEKTLDSEKYIIKHCYSYGSPSIEMALLELEKKVNSFLFVPLFPQYSKSTTGSAIAQVHSKLQEKKIKNTFLFMESFHKSKAFIDQSVHLIDEKIKEFNDFGNGHLILSFHGIPKRQVFGNKDPYYLHCCETFFLLQDRCRLPPSQIHLTFQSRFGSEEWLTPYTDDYINDLLQSGVKKFIVYAPSFVSDCLENLDEIGYELRKKIEQKEGTLLLIPSLNSGSEWCEQFGQYLETYIDHSQEIKKREYEVPKEKIMEIPKQKMKSPPLTSKAKSSIKIVFLTLFLDLVGFSIIFPLFPSIAKHYLEVDPDNYFLRLIFDSINSLVNTGGVLGMGSIVLFGGALGALYSFLQFLAAPIWGGISDRIGRRPVLLISVAGLALSYFIWIFSKSFTLLILSRFIGGIMGGNISTATAVVADVTQRENRSKGMAFVGIAFAFGFILGPAIGGLSFQLDLANLFPALVPYGLNPFSAPALIAFLLSLLNLFYLSFKFKETLPLEKRGKGQSDRSFNLFHIFKPLPYKGVNLTNLGHFLFLMAFSGMEFTLTFLALERLSYTPMDNAYMFIFIGFIIALVQGGYVRRKASDVGEKNMVLRGLLLLIPGLVLIGMANSSIMLYGGLAFLATGASLIIPCLTSLVSLYTPPEYQGRSIGIFRSMGALARVVGPVLASILYWRFGSSLPYFAGAAFLLIPFLLVSKLPFLEKGAKT